MMSRRPKQAHASITANSASAMYNTMRGKGAGFACCARKTAGAKSSAPASADLMLFAMVPSRGNQLRQTNLALLQSGQRAQRLSGAAILRSIDHVLRWSESDT